MRGGRGNFRLVRRKLPTAFLKNWPSYRHLYRHKAGGNTSITHKELNSPRMLNSVPLSAVAWSLHLESRRNQPIGG